MATHDHTPIIGDGDEGPPAITPRAMADHFGISERKARRALDGAVSTGAVECYRTETGEFVYWWADGAGDDS